jgi:ABC-type sugar transport system ATPase subunit
MADIRVERLRKVFGPVVALDDVDFSFPDSSVTCLLGPSGCGKTTLMRIIAGLEAPTSGDVFFGERRVTCLPPRKREIGMVFQYPVVYKGINVRENIELPLKSEKLSAADRRRRVDEVIEVLGLAAAADKDVSRLDNGTRQKVAVAREVARQPRIILFDEPITNVDATAKLQLKRAFKELTRRLSQTIVYVTHDQTEAMTLADQIALMRDGRIVQCDAPRTLYNRPADRFAGWFLGNPGMAFFDAELHGSGAFLTLVSPLFPTPLAVEGRRWRPVLRQWESGPNRSSSRRSASLLRYERGSSESPSRSAASGSCRSRRRVWPARPSRPRWGPEEGSRLPESGEVFVSLPPGNLTLFGPDGDRLPAVFPAALTAAAD